MGSTLAAPPAQIRIAFTEKLEPALSSIRVLDATGKQVDRKDLRAEAGDPSMLRVTLPLLAPGIYKVSWRAVSVDTHVTKGEFTFEVTAH